MAENPKTIYDTLSSFQDGINSGVQPLLLPKTQCSFAINATFRGGYIQDRPPFQKQLLNYNGNTVLQALVETGYFQGAGIYRPDFGASIILAQIKGHLISFTLTEGAFDVADVSIAGDLNDPSTGQVWMWQSEKWMIISDGSGKLPIFYDGVKSRRSFGATKVIAQGIATSQPVAPELNGSVVITLLNPYTGAIGVPVIFNGHYYNIVSSVIQPATEPVPSPVLVNTPRITIKNLNVTPGTIIPERTQFVAQGVLTSQSREYIPAAVPMVQAFNASTNSESIKVADVYVSTQATQTAWNLGGFNYPAPPYDFDGVPGAYRSSTIDNNVQDVAVLRSVPVSTPYTVPAGTITQVDFSETPAVSTFVVGQAVILNVYQSYSTTVGGYVPVDPNNSNGALQIVNTTTNDLINRQTITFFVTEILNGGKTLKLRNNQAIVGIKQWSYTGGETFSGNPYRELPGWSAADPHYLPDSKNTVWNPKSGSFSPLTPSADAFPITFQGRNYQCPAWKTGFTTASRFALFANPPGKPEFFSGGTNYLGDYVTLTNSQNNVSPIQIAAFQYVALGSYTTPNVVVAISSESVPAPAVGSNVTVNVNSQYVGTPNKNVLLLGDASVNGKAVTVIGVAAQPPPPPPIPGTPQVQYLTLSNLSDAPLSQITNKDIISIPELPAGRMGAYINQRNIMSLTDGISFMVGDIVGGASGTAEYNYRDAVLRSTENTFLVGGGTFRIPSAGTIIRSITPTAILDASFGQGQGQLGTDSGFYGVNLPIDRATWVAITEPILPASLLGDGSLTQNSTIQVNSDIVFRSVEGIGSLKIARRDFNGDLGGNSPISREIERALKNDNISLLPYGSAVTFDNRMLMTCYPAVSNQGVFHQGLVALNYDLISSLRGKAPAVYDGLWTGLNFLQALSGNFSGLGRLFAFGYNITNSKIELYEMLRSTGGKHFDNHDTRIKWLFETPVLFGQDVKKLAELIRLKDGEISIQDIIGKVDFKIEYKPDYYPCWVTWKEFQVCSDMTSDHAKPGYITRIGFGEPAGDVCEDGNNRPFRNAHFFQLRITITGHCKVMGIRLAASPEPIVDFARPICEQLCEPDLPLPDL